MKVPVIFVEEVALPGVPGELELEPEVAEGLESWGQWLGFGTLEVVILGPARDDAPASADNHTAFGIQAEVMVADGDPPRLVIREGRRARPGAIEEQAAGHASGWVGPVTEATSAPASTDGVTPELKDNLQRAFFQWLLARAPGADEEGLARAIVDPVVVMERDLSSAETCYLAAEFVHEDRQRRRQLIEAEALLPEVEALLAELRANGGDEIERRENLLGVLEELLDSPMRDLLDGLEATRRLIGLGLVRTSPSTSKSLKVIHKRLGDLQEDLGALMHKIDEEA